MFQNYFSGVPLVSLMNLKQLLSMSSYIIRMFFMCYLFADNNEQVRTRYFNEKTII